MRKVIILLIMVINLFAISGCDPSSYYYDYETLSIDVKSIELIDYENENATELFEKRDKVKSFDFNKMITINVLDEEQEDNFLREFSEIEFMLVWRHLDSPKGKSVKINYQDGSFDIICYRVQFSCQYDSFGNVKYLIGSSGGNSLKELVEQSFDMN